MLNVGVSQVNRPGPRNPLVYADPDAHGLFKDVVSGDRINHAAWLRACATHSFVGTCRVCGSPMVPRSSHDIQRGEVMCTDYEAECTNLLVEVVENGQRTTTGCGAVILAPNGRLARRKRWRVTPRDSVRDT